MPVRMSRLGAGLSVGLMLAACGNGSEPVDVSTVEVTPAADTLRTGTTAQLVATPRDSKGKSVSGVKITWTSADTMIATVASDGTVMGVRDGSVTISAKAGGITGTADVRVWRGSTGAWTGAVMAGANTCPLTQSVTEAEDGSISGTGTLGAPCSAGNYTITGTNNAGGVADSVHMHWSGGFQLDLDGPFDGVGSLSGLITGGGCTGTSCPYGFTRGSLDP